VSGIGGGRLSGSRLTVAPPEDYVLHRDVCSYGYFLLEPNHWDPDARSLRRVLEVGRAPVAVVISQAGDAGGAPGDRLVVRCDRTLSRGEQRVVRRQIVRMLHLDGAGSAEAVRAFHRADKRFRRSGRGRLLRSPTLFEDVIKTVTSCNVAWPSTIVMNRRLCEVVNPAFPRAAQLARRRPASLRARCRVGYRDVRIVELAKLAQRKGSVIHPDNEAWLTSPDVSDDEVDRALQTLPGIGPYAAANIMQLLGRYGRLPVDTETHRHARVVLGYEGSERELTKRIGEHYAPFGEHMFRSYWFELWDFYESKRGKAWTWDRETTGASFTASALG
jgi:3-methyladenine DNA glycosylase/8-oxoguanine DNA glycosylase